MGNKPGDHKIQWLKETLIKYEGRLLRYVARLLPEQSARDVVQETFVKLWQEDPSRLAGHEAPWLFRVCRNRALDVLKKEGRMNPFDSDQAKSPDDPEATVERRQTTSQVFAIMAELPTRKQEVLRLKFQEGLSYREISQVTGISESHVGVMIFEGLQHIRKRLHPAQPSIQGGLK